MEPGAPGSAYPQLLISVVDNSADIGLALFGRMRRNTAAATDARIQNCMRLEWTIVA
jgi:hypothetical protein